MVKTVNFCGDSFCADTSQYSWVTLLSNKLDATLLGTGKEGSAHEHAIQTFDPRSDITIFCWTEANRLYHPEYPLNSESSITHRKKNVIYEAAYQFYQHIHNKAYCIERQKRDLYWFDKEILSNYKGIAICLWCFERTYYFKHAHNFELPPLTGIKNKETEDNINHMNKQMNKLIAHKIYNFIRKING